MSDKPRVVPSLAELDEKVYKMMIKLNQLEYDNNAMRVKLQRLKEALA